MLMYNKKTFHNGSKKILGAILTCILKIKIIQSEENEDESINKRKRQ